RRGKKPPVVGGEPKQGKGTLQPIGNGGVGTTPAGRPPEGREGGRAQEYGGIGVDPGPAHRKSVLPNGENESDEKTHQMPIIIYTGRELTQDEETKLKRFSEAIIVKSAKSMEQLLDETALFLHRVEANLPEPKRKMLKAVHQADPVFEGKRVLVVDDD